MRWIMLVVVGLGVRVVLGEELKLVSARENVPGCFTTSRNVCADEERVYLSSRGGLASPTEGKLFVLKKSLAGDFPIVQELSLPRSSAAVRGTSDKLYVVCDNGSVQVFNKTWPLTFDHSVQVSGIMLGDLEVASDGMVYVSIGDGSIAADEEKLYYACISDNRQVKRLGSTQTFQGAAWKVQIFSRQTGAVLGSIPFPELQGYALSAGENHLYLARGRVWMYDKATLAFVQEIQTGSANTAREVVKNGQRLLVVGEESGIVSLWDCAGVPAVPLSSINLSVLTGFTQSEAVEIRGLWIDPAEGLIYAASSWGNDTLRAVYGGELPSAFVAGIGCPPLLFDTDFDHDVDQSDFGFFQTCLGPLPAWGPCACFDRTGDGGVGAADLPFFEACAAGPGVSVSACP